ncbi:MAG: hypothetical protein SGJ21_01220 [Alphaproteobacteria bacterium]|nr:hypothetical protein [Alphaproteobacteria bacterium]
MRGSWAVLILASGLAGRATGSVIVDDDDAPAVVSQALDLTCGWLVDGSDTPTREKMERLGWTPWMSREGPVIPEFMQRFQEGRPALASFSLTFRQRGNLLAGCWEDHCSGGVGFERGRSIESLVDGVPLPTAEFKPSLAALETWTDRVLPDSVPMQPDFKSGDDGPFMARADRKFAFLAVVDVSGWGMEWRLMPTDKLLAPAQPSSSGVKTPPE